MLGFLRRRGARGSELGAAVTGIPSAPVAPVLPALPAAPAPFVAAPPAPVVPAVEDRPAAPVPASAGPRVELGFRDGSSAALDPGSEAAQALDELARMLARRS